MRFETGKKKGTTSFQAGEYAQHMLIFFTDSQLDMLIGAMFIKNKTCLFKFGQRSIIHASEALEGSNT